MITRSDGKYMALLMFICRIFKEWKMREQIIDISGLTKDYGHGRGVFDVSIKVNEGECYGFLGPNGAGKTTAIRHLMGFSKPEKGTCTIRGKDCWKESAELKSMIGYLPGEISFPSGMTGSKFLKMIMKMRGMQDDRYCRELLERFELDADIDLDQMSLGTRRKLAVVTAFMHDPDILILDEPTSGLDPMMQQIFIDYIASEKERGKTILLSSHMFHEVDATCDRIAVIKDGRIVSEFITEDLRQNHDSIYRLTFGTRAAFDHFCRLPYQMTVNANALTVRVTIPAADLNTFIKEIAGEDFIDFIEVPFTLEDYFMGFYKGERDFEEVR